MSQFSELTIQPVYASPPRYAETVRTDHHEAIQLSPDQVFQQGEDLTPVEQLVQPGFFISTSVKHRKKKVNEPSTEERILKKLKITESIIDDDEKSEFAKPVPIIRPEKKIIRMDDLDNYVRWGFFQHYTLLDPIDYGDTACVMSCAPKHLSTFKRKPNYAVKRKGDNYNKLNRIDYSRLLKCQSCFSIVRELQGRIHVVSPASYLSTLKALQEAAVIPGVVSIVDMYLEDAHGEMISYIIMKKYDRSMENMWRKESSPTSKKRMKEERFHALYKIVSTLKEMFAQGITHTDIKPNNIFTKQGVLGMKYRVGDFGDCYVRTTKSDHMVSFIENLLMLCQNVFSVREMARVREIVPEETSRTGECIPEFVDCILTICSQNVKNVGDMQLLREIKHAQRRLKRKNERIIREKDSQIAELNSTLQVLIQNSSPELLKKLNIVHPPLHLEERRAEPVDLQMGIQAGRVNLKDDEDESVLGKRKRDVGARIEGFEMDSQKRKTM